MDRQTRNSLVAAAIILAGFGLAAYFMPAIMLWLGEISPVAAGLVAFVFVFGFFGLFWLRGRSRR